MPSENLESTTGVDARLETRRRREQRTDHVLEVPFHTNQVDVECPECDHEFAVSIFIPLDEPSFGGCPNWDCDAYLKKVHDGTDPRPDPEPEEASEQTALEQFNRGASA